MLSSLIGLSRVLASSMLATSFAAPVEWSPNGQWLAYTITDAESTSLLDEGWLHSEDQAPISAAASRGGGKYRIWAEKFGARNSVLIEESRWPLSSPTWSMDGRSLVFGRFVPASGDADQAVVHGRYEVVVQSGLDQKKEIVVLPELDLDSEQLAAVVGSKPEISPDGRYLAVPRPGKTPGVVIVRLDQGAVVKTIEGAIHASWAPDGLRLAFIQESVGRPGDTTRTIHILNRDLGSARPLTGDVALLDAPPIWSLDGQSVLALGLPSPAATRDVQVDLVRIGLDAGPSTRIMNLERLPSAAQRERTARFLMRRPSAGPGIPRVPGADSAPLVLKCGLSLDHEQEMCSALIEINDQEQALRWCNVRSQATLKRIHPLDLSIRIAAPSISPDGQTVAFRVEAPGLPALPAYCDMATESVTLIAPDAPTRRVWIELLALHSAELLKLPRVPAASRSAANGATILPPAHEIAGNNSRQIRLRHIAKIARGLLDSQGPAEAHVLTAHESASQAKLRLFFDYLYGDYGAAATSLATLEALPADPEIRLRWLCLRAQILIGQGEIDRARGIVEYVTRVSRPQAHTIEDTPLGPVASTIPNPSSEWSTDLRLTLSLAEAQRSRGLASGADNGEEIETITPSDEGNGVGGRGLDIQPQLPFIPGPQHEEAAGGFDPARFGGRMIVPPPRPRFSNSPLLPGAQPIEPPAPRL